MSKACCIGGIPGNSLVKRWCQRQGLNPRPKAYESSALPLSYSGNQWESGDFSPSRLPLHRRTVADAVASRQVLKSEIKSGTFLRPSGRRHKDEKGKCGDCGKNGAHRRTAAASAINDSVYRSIWRGFQSGAGARTARRIFGIPPDPLRIQPPNHCLLRVHQHLLHAPGFFVLGGHHVGVADIAGVGVQAKMIVIGVIGVHTCCKRAAVHGWPSASSGELRWAMACS